MTRDLFSAILGGIAGGAIAAAVVKCTPVLAWLVALERWL